MARLQFVYGPAIHPVGAISCVPIFVLMLLDIEMTDPVSRRVTNGILTLLFCALLILSFRHASFARWVWISAATTIPVIVGIGAIVLLRVESKTKETSTFMLLLATVAMCSLIEFPYFAPMYFFYVAPLAIVALTALYVQVKQHQFRSILLPLAGLYMAYAISVIMPNQIYNQALSFNPVAQKAFTLPRASGLVGPKSTVETTEQAVTTLLAHAGGAPIYAGPDSPEFYFLTGLKNCTPNLVEFASGVDGEPSHILASIGRSGVKAVLLNHTPGNDSGPLAPELETKLRNRFPESMTIGLLEVRWRQ